VELGEIETVLMKHAAVRECVVVVHEERGSKNLAAYYTSSDGQAAESGELRSFLFASLPAYMAPAFFLHLNEIPRTANGKLDRNALPKIQADQSSVKRTVRPARNEREERLLAICSEVLSIEQIGIDDNLFELGADSIQIFRIVARANRCGINLTAQQILTSPSVEVLAGDDGLDAASCRNPGLSPIRRVSREAYRMTAKN
jgi:aryl carrier-like protein